MPSTRPSDWFLIDRDTRLQPAFTSGNAVRPLIDGEAYFAVLTQEIEQLGSAGFVHFAGWRVTPTASLDPAAPALQTFQELLAQKLQDGVKVRALLWNLPGTTNDFSAGHGVENLALFEFLNAADPGSCILDDRLPHGNFPSHHQKYFVLSEGSQSVAFVGGLDIALDRWDVQAHDEPDARQSQIERFRGWHDVQAMVRGPAVGQIWKSFAERWSDPRTPNRMVPHDTVLNINAEAPTATGSAGQQHVQILRTYACRSFAFPFDDPTVVPSNLAYPFAPNGEYTYQAALVKAISRAEAYVYLEDQYFWPCAVVDAIADAAARGVTIILVLQRTYDVPGLEPYHNFMRQRALQAVADRMASGTPAPLFHYHLLQHRTPGQVEGDEIYVHAKTVIIDDCYAVIGSANINHRSMTNDSEIGLAVVDGDTETANLRGQSHSLCRFARRYRMALWKEHLGLEIDDPLNADGTPNGFPTDPNQSVGHVHLHKVPEPKWCSPSFVRTAVMNPQLRCG
jgi:phosphatidylserine/phosphatidylglycerophosphate/cardiolipin synthase-like enzyme